ncbi:AbrB/MazE/SpoVT family DNA-binding domain-containing protein [Nanoarchaeota archaeon]
MQRKVNQIGPSTLMVSLPSKWVKINKISKGDDVEIIENGKELRIGVNLNEEYKKIDIKVRPGNNWYTSQIVRNLYLSGYDEIKVEYDDENVINKIQKNARLLLGFEIIEQKKNSCTLRNLSSGVESELDNLIRKVFLMTESMFEMSIEQLENNKPDLEKIIDIRNNIHRFTNLCRRIITKKQKYNIVKNTSLYNILTSINVITHNIMYAHQYLDSKKSIPSLKPSAKYLRKVLRVFNVFHKAYYSKNVESMYDIQHSREALINNEFVSILEKSKGENVVLCYYFAEIARFIASIQGAALIKYHLND